ncbi:FtsQ-type POTRA domain-containing protein [Akkermansiaceae bacterium]|nr:FtsQ-type POTRA domain-containing protein [Akkermansiaceae bacterium]
MHQTPRSMRKRSSRARSHRHHAKVLQADVMSPRIAWFTFLGFLRGLGKLALVIVALLAAAYGIRQAVEHTFHRNPDFRLQAIKLNENDVLDEEELVTRLRIDLSSNIFDFDIGRLERELLEMPAIATAEVERNLPGTLDFRITTRKPAAWIACAEEGFQAGRKAGLLLVDHDGFAYPCPVGQAEHGQDLPVLMLASDPAHPIRPGKTLEHPQYGHCLKLLKAIVANHPGELRMVDVISQANEWSLTMRTRSGTLATFGLGDHGRQLGNLAIALDHSRTKGYHIETINLIPKRNVPITVSGDDAPPRAIPVPEESVVGAPADRRAEDIHNLLNRN